MKPIAATSIFTQLYGLIIAAILVNHLAFLLLVFTLPKFFTLPPPPGYEPPSCWSRQADTPGAQKNQVSPPSTGKSLPEAPRPVLFSLILAVQLAIFAVAAWFGMRMVARPIERLTHAASQLGEDLNAPAIEETGPSETRQAARIFNVMQERIRVYVAERAQFLAAISHDLRTPLTRMRLRVERLPDDSSRAKLRDDIAEMSALLDAALDYLRGDVADEPPVRLDVQALVESMAENALENGETVEVTGSAKLLNTRPLALRRCLANLIENALRYGFRARIRLMDSADELVIEISDDGPGIPEADLEAVFKPFVRLEVSRNKETGGLGLGLAIARDAAARCGGSVTLGNAPAGGLVATLRLSRANGQA